MYHAARNEITGTAVYHEPGIKLKYWTSEPVTRDSAPAKFRQATNYFWAGAALGLTGAVVAWNVSRKVDSATDF